MKMIFALLIALFSLQIQAQTYEMTCNFEYETYSSIDEVTDSFTVIGQKDASGLMNFSTSVLNLPAYFFPEDRYGAYWHKDSSIYFNAQIQGTTLRYSFIFNNHIHDYVKVKTVYNQTRVLDVSRFFIDRKIEFDYDDGKVTNSEINHEPWVNENHIQIENCKISYFH